MFEIMKDRTKILIGRWGMILFVIAFWTTVILLLR